jgi:ribonuclease T1
MKTSTLVARALVRRTFFVLALLFCWYPAHAFAPGEIEATALPREGRAVFASIRKGGPFAYPKDGVTFGNFEGQLPKKRRGYYREYTVETPGSRNRGARRIVCGGEARDWERNAPAACYYTDDHYASFRRIRE